jgi:hypothetical protein
MQKEKEKTINNSRMVFSQRQIAKIIQDCIEGTQAFTDEYNNEWSKGYDDGVKDVTDGIKRRLGLNV